MDVMHRIHDVIGAPRVASRAEAVSA